MRRIFSGVALILITAQLSGCVAAIPVVAAGTMVGRKRLKLGKPKHSALAGAQTRSSKIKVSKGGKRSQVVPAAAIAPPPLDPLYRPFVDYALQQHQAGIAGAERASAILSTSSSLDRPDFTACGTSPSAAIVDVDVVPMETAQVARLDAALKELRTGGVKILWIADANVAGAGQIRDTLWANGGVGDPEDRLLLKRRADDRKQTLRREAAESYCVVAIAGKRKGDMDELFDYLRDPNLAYRFDRYWGSGWFIIPDKPAVDLTEKDRNALDPR